MSTGGEKEFSLGEKEPQRERTQQTSINAVFAHTE